MGFGGNISFGNSKLLDGPLGVVKIGFNGYDLGKTTADTNLSPDQDIKDIIYQQDGTKAADHVRTGIDVILSCTLGEISTPLLAQLMAGITSQNVDANSDSLTFDRSLYQSMRDQEAKVLKIASVNSNGVASELDEDTFLFYEAIPIISGELVNWGADTQRNLPCEFRIKWHLFSTGESSTKDGAFGYLGDPTTEDVPVAVWPDVEAPEVLTAVADSATNLTVTFDEVVAFVGGSFTAGSVAVTIDGAFVLATAGAIQAPANDDKIDFTFPAATFAAGQVLKLYISDGVIEDQETVANEFEGISGFIVTNSAP